MRLIIGDRPREPFITGPKILTLPDMPHSVLGRLSSSLSTTNIFMNMLKDLDSAEDSDSDRIINIYKIYSYLLEMRTMNSVK